MNRSRFLISAAAAAVFLPAPVRCAAQALPAPSPATASRTLQQALVDASVPRDGLYLAVAADRVTLPSGAQPPQKDDSPDTVAAAYGRITSSFNTVTAIAPPTMVVLNTNPGTPNPYASMPPAEVIKIFLAGLNDSQWKALTGTTGIGLQDLTGDDQRNEFFALFQLDRMKVQNVDAPGAPPTLDLKNLLKSICWSPTPITQSDIAQAHLRLGQAVQVSLPVIGRNNRAWLSEFPKFGNADYEAYDISGIGQADQDVLYGVRVRSAVPNAPKPFDLDLDAPALNRDVALNGVKTVGDLVAMIAKTTGIEIYADRNYEGRAVALVGMGRARARDLISALALCVTGAYRKVGPAYVLTDDVAGAGARRLIIRRFAGEGKMALQGMVMDVGDKLITAHPIGSLPLLDEALAFSDAQKEEIAKQDPPAISEGPHALLPISKLTPSQQAFVQAFAARVNAAHNQPVLTTDDKIRLETEPQILLVVPSVPDPISLSAYCNCLELYQPSDKLSQQLTPAAAPESPAQPEKPSSPPALGPLLAAYPRRAVYAAPRTAAEVDALMDSMKALDLNALYLDVFSGGHAHISGSDLPHDDFKAHQTDILTEALKRGKEASIAVLPTLDLLRWGTDAPEDVRDLTILGETSSQAAAWQSLYVAVAYEGRTLEDAQKDPPPSSVFVSPSAEKVQDGLTVFVKELAAKPGVGGIVFRDTVAPGYDRPADSHYASGRAPVGYTVPMRLASLRQEHVDPVDLVDLNADWYFGDVFVDLSLPEFDDYGRQEGASLQRWYGYCNSVDVAFMRKLFDAAQAFAPHQVWVAQRRQADHGDWYALWDKRDASLPEIPDNLVNEYSNPDRNFAPLAHAQSPLAVTAVAVQSGETPEALATALKDIKLGWDGIVLNCASDPGGYSLKKLAASSVTVKPLQR